MIIRIVLADDHRIMRDGLAALVQSEPDFKLVGTAHDGATLVKLVTELKPDVVVTDVSMPGMNGIEAIRRIRVETPAAKVLCLSVHDEDSMVLAGIEAGASGYVLKDTSFGELAGAIRTVMVNKIYLSPSLVDLFVRGDQRRNQTAAEAPFSTLTRRERQIAQLFSEGHSTRQIGEQLHVSGKTVATHRENILHKLRIHSIAELTRYAIREGLSSLSTPCRPRSVEAAVA